ncbi:hypothetical protein IRB23SM22_17740 [Alkalibacterium sp. s-m-22]
MNKKTNIIISGVVAALVVVALIWFINANDGNLLPAGNSKEVSVIIRNQSEEMVDDTIEADENDNLLDIMIENYDIEVTEEGFIEAIEGAEQDVSGNLFWVYEVNEEMVPVGAEEFIPEDGDSIVWELTEF